ncbi:hypothetical protein ACFL0V_00600, partial [Nanoarchaeota archaeon]
RTTTTTVSGEERAKQIATAYIRNIDGYKSFNGRNLKFKNVFNSGGDGDWIVDASFIRDAQMSDYQKEEPINIHLNIKKWKADSYTFN